MEGISVSTFPVQVSELLHMCITALLKGSCACRGHSRGGAALLLGPISFLSSTPRIAHTTHALPQKGTKSFAL